MKRMKRERDREREKKKMMKIIRSNDKNPHSHIYVHEIIVERNGKERKRSFGANPMRMPGFSHKIRNWRREEKRRAKKLRMAKSAHKYRCYRKNTHKLLWLCGEEQLCLHHELYNLKYAKIHFNSHLFVAVSFGLAFAQAQPYRAFHTYKIYLARRCSMMRVISCEAVTFGNHTVQQQINAA